MTTKVSRNKLLQNIKDSYKTATVAITIVTNAMDHMNCSKKSPSTNRNTQISSDTRKLNDKYGRSYQLHNPSTPPPTTATTNTTSYSTVSVNFTQRPNREMEIPKHKTLNNALVPTNETSSTTWKLRENHAPLPPLPHRHNTEICPDSKIILFQGSKLENQHTRKTCRILSWVYKPSDNPIVIGGGNPCWSYRS